MDARWLSDSEHRAWIGLAAVVELLPGVLDSQLRRDAQLTHFEYVTLVMLSEAPKRTLRMSALAAQTNATLPRLSHVVARLEKRGLVARRSCADDARATDVVLTPVGRRKVRHSAPGHVATVRAHVINALSAEQISELRDISEAILDRLDPDGQIAATLRDRD